MFKKKESWNLEISNATTRIIALKLYLSHTIAQIQSELPVWPPILFRNSQLVLEIQKEAFLLYVIQKCVSLNKVKITIRNFWIKKETILDTLNT